MKETPSSRTERVARARRPRPTPGTLGLLGEVEQALADREAVRARVVLRRQVPERQVQLGRKHQHGQAGLEAEPALGEADADGHGDEGDPERGRELEHGAGEERDAERAHRRAPVLVADLLDPLGLRAAAVERAQGRQPADDVQEVRREQPERLAPLRRAPLRVAADQPHEHGHEREREQHDPGGEQVDRRDERKHGDGDDEREHELREVARERGLERVHAADGERRHLGALGAVEGRRPVAESALDDVQAQVGERARRRPAPGHLEAPGGRSAARRHDDEEDERGQELPERGAREAARRDAREQHRLGEDEERGNDARARRRPRA